MNSYNIHVELNPSRPDAVTDVFTVEAENSKDAALLWANTEEGRPYFKNDGQCVELAITDKDNTMVRYLVRGKIAYEFKLFSEVVEETGAQQQ